MATVPNYLIGGGVTPAVNPFQTGLAEGMRFGSTMQDFQAAQLQRQQAKEDREFQLKERQRLLTLETEKQQRITDIRKKLNDLPMEQWTAKNAIEYASTYPDITQQSMKELFAKLPEGGQLQQVKTLGGITSAVRSGNIDVAKSLITEQIEANKEKDPQESARYKNMLETLNVNPSAVFTTIAPILAAFGKPGQDTLKSILEADKLQGEIAGQKTKDLPASIAEVIGYQQLTPEQKTIFQSIQTLKKPPAAVTNIKISDLEGGSQKELAKLVPDLYDRANSAVSQLNELPRYRASLDKAIVGPLAEQRLNVAKVANVLGFTGENSINATREVIQGLSEMALQSRSMLTGQGQITENEQKLLIKARSGDINFNKGELNTIFNVAERASKAQYDKTTKLLQSAAGKSPTAAMFLENVSQLPIKTTQAPAAGQRNINVDY